MEETRVLILSAAVGAGHKTAARALEKAFRKYPHVQVANQDILDMTNDAYSRISSEVYLEAVKRVPWLVGVAYQYNDEPFKNEEPLRRMWDILNTQPVVKFLKDFQPHICVCTHYTPAGIVAQMMAQGQLDTSLSVVITDFDFQGMWLSKTFNRYFVAREEAKARLVDFDVEPEHITVSGIPVDSSFGEPVDAEAVARRYELDPALPTLLISAGAVGGGPALEIVTELMKLRHEAQTVVVCGSNAQLRRDVETLVLPQARKFRALGFTSDMPDLIRAATLFIGKPGGLTASECIAAGTPMIIVEPIPGQEERNADYLLEEGAALRCNDLEIIDYKIDQLLDSPERLAQLRANARRIGRPDAADVIAATALADENAPVKFDWRSQRKRLLAEPLAAEPLAKVERALFGPDENETLAFYEDGTGVFLGTLDPAQFRSLRRRLFRSGEEVATTTVTQDDLDRIRALGMGSELVDRISKRVRFRGPITLRRVRISLPEGS
ncbi:glycosyltransferase [Chloroflexia bacterium SDU3-3]|nr:glycosyltransferase [Chloroflexia bacterium SDU3-3]